MKTDDDETLKLKRDIWNKHYAKQEDFDVAFDEAITLVREDAKAEFIKSFQKIQEIKNTLIGNGSYYSGWNDCFKCFETEFKQKIMGEGK